MVGKDEDPPGRLTSGHRYALVIGDVVESRNASSQEELLTDLHEAHRWLNSRLKAVEPMTTTVGDEFQGVFRSIREALEAAVLLRLHLLGRYDLRFGLGWGAVTTIAPEKAPLAQSGEGWWRAREAIEEAADLAGKRGWPRTVRMRARGLPEPVQGAVLAFLLCQDHLLGTMDDKDARITLGLFEGRLQAELAEELGIAQSSISRRQSENGPSTIYRAHQQLAGLLP